MKQEDKDLLLKDLCARLDTNLVCSIYRTDDEGVGYRDEVLHGYCRGDIWEEFYFGDDCGIGMTDLSKIKPYLFPLSSMNKEQKEEYESLCVKNTSECTNLYDIIFAKGYYDTIKSIDYLYKNHIDIRGLIPIGLAIDATDLNIYQI